MCPVGKGGGKELRVGNEHNRVVVGFHLCGTNVHLAHHSENAAHFHHIAFADDPAENNHKAAGEVLDDILHAEAHAHAETPGYNREAGQTEPQAAENVKNKKGPQGVSVCGLKGADQAGVQRHALAAKTVHEGFAH